MVTALEASPSNAAQPIDVDQAVEEEDPVTSPEVRECGPASRLSKVLGRHRLSLVPQTGHSIETDPSSTAPLMQVGDEMAASMAAFIAAFTEDEIVLVETPEALATSAEAGTAWVRFRDEQGQAFHPARVSRTSCNIGSEYRLTGPSSCGLCPPGLVGQQIMEARTETGTKDERAVNAAAREFVEVEVSVAAQVRARLRVGSGLRL